MPVFNSRTALDIARDVKAFLNVRATLTRNGASGPAPTAARARRGKSSLQSKANKDEVARLKAELARAKGAAGQAGADAPIFFLIGRSKSGTSWLMRLLDSHPEILCRGEAMFFQKSSPRSLIRALSRSEEVQSWLARNPWTRQAPEAGLERMMGTFVREAMLQRLEEVRARNTTKRIVGDKSPFKTPEVVGEIAAICPEARVVHIIRDGRDVVVSSAHHRWNRWANAADDGRQRDLSPEQVATREAYRSDPSAFGAGGESIFADGHVAEIARSWASSVGGTVEKAALLGDNYHEVRYEELLANPVDETQRLLGFLGADAGAETARRCVEAASFEQLSGGRAQGEEDSSSFYRKGVAGDWKNNFTEEDKEVFKREAGETLIRLGYEKDLDW